MNMCRRWIIVLFVTILAGTTSFVGARLEGAQKPNNPVGEVTATPHAPWPMFRHDHRHTGRSPYAGPEIPNLKWSLNTGDSIASSPAVGADGTIYVGSWDRTFYAVNPNGSLKWTYTTKGNSSPAIEADGTIYVGSNDNKLYAINPDGLLKWSFPIGDDITSSPMIGADGTIYVGSFADLYAINSDGSAKWYFAAGDAIFSSPAEGADGTIYVGSGDHNLYAIDSNGSVKWSYTTGGFIESSPAIDSDETIYIGSNDKKLYAINNNGFLKWSYTTGNFIQSSPAIGTDGTIYVGSGDHNLYAINSDGSLKWSYSTGGYITSSPAIGADGTIYVGSYDDSLHAINPDGSLKWIYATGHDVTSSPAIASDGTIYFGSWDGRLYAITEAMFEVWVDDDWADCNPGDTVDGHIFGTDAFGRIQDGIDAVASPGTVHVAAGTYVENITLKNGVQALGAGADLTIIDGGGSTSAVTAIGVDAETMLDGFTVTGGSAQYGGGINIEKSQITVTHCTIVGNTGAYGGGISVGGDSSPMMSGNIIDSNLAFYGGGIFIRGYSASGCRPTVVSNTISENSAETYGGGIYFENASPVILSNLITENTAEVYEGGGICHFLPSEAFIINNIIVHNSAARYGGGIDSHTNSMDGPHPTIINNTISFNSATSGGGLRTFYSRAIISNNIISHNSEQGVYCHTPSEPFLRHNDVYNNGGGNYGGSCSDLTGTEGNISVDPMYVDAVGGDYHLQPGSPCIDAGTNDVSILPDTDIEGDARIIDGDNDDIATVDIGADEYVGSIVKAYIRIYPRVFNLKSRGKRFMCQIKLPEKYDPLDIDKHFLELSIPSCSDCKAINVTCGFPFRRRYLAFFLRQDLIDEIENMDLELPAKLDLKVNGELNDGTLFEGSGTVWAIERRDSGSKKNN